MVPLVPAEVPVPVEPVPGVPLVSDVVVLLPGVLFEVRVPLVPGRFPVFGSVLVPVVGAGLLVPGMVDVLVFGSVLVPGR